MAETAPNPDIGGDTSAAESAAIATVMPETAPNPDIVAEISAAESPAIVDVSPPPVATEAPADAAPAPVVIAEAVLPSGYMRDPRGRLVPKALVKPEQLLEDELVREIHEDAAKVSTALRDFRDKAFANIEALLGLLADKYGVTLGGDRGNLTLDTFDGTLIVSVSIGDQLDFGPELQVAKQLIDACIHRWSEGASVELQAIVNGAFDVDKKGKLNVGRILALRRYNIDDVGWKKAMEAIGNAARIVSSKRYLRLHRKIGDKAKEQVPLDLASV